MTMEEVLDTVSESPLWESLTVDEKRNALADAIEAAFGNAAVREAQPDIAGIVGELFGG